MDAYILSPTFQSVGVHDEFSSFIWTERYSSPGEFILTVTANAKNEAKFALGRYVGVLGSDELCLIERSEKKAGLLTLKGKTLLNIMKHRWFEGANVATLSPQARVASFIAQHLTTPTATGYIPNLTLDSVPSGTALPFPSSPAQGNLWEAVQPILDTWELGLTIKKAPGETDSFLASVYLGVDRRSTQSSVPTVILSETLDDLYDVTTIKSIENQDSWIWAQVGLVSSGHGQYGATGFSRREYHIYDEGTGLTEAQELDLVDKLRAQATKQHRALAAVDGTLSSEAKHQYGVDYFMGDILELRNQDGVKSDVRVTEYIRAHDAEGYRAYPTLTAIE